MKGLALCGFVQLQVSTGVLNLLKGGQAMYDI